VSSSTIALLAVVVPVGSGVLGLLYKMGSVMGIIAARLDDLERRAAANEAAITARLEGYKRRPNGI